MSNSKRRGNNEGTITKRKDGRWEGRITIGYSAESGKPKRICLYGKTRKEVQEQLNKTLVSVQAGTFSEPTKVTLEEWDIMWLQEYMRTSVRPSTYASYDGIIRRHINQVLGMVLLKDLRPEQIQALYNNLSKEGLSAKTVRNVHVVLHKCLDQAIKNDLISRNPSDATSLPKRLKTDIRVLSTDEQNKFMNAIKGEKFEMIFLLDLFTGLRAGELLGLRWSDVDLDKKFIHVNQTLNRVQILDESSPTKTKIIFSEPKTKAGKRIVPIMPQLLEKLEEYKHRQDDMKQLMGKDYNKMNLVFCQENGAYIEPRLLIEYFHRMIKKAGIPDANLHCLRHTFATRLLELNEHPKVVQELMGHNSITITLDTYSHVCPEIKKLAVDKLNSLYISVENNIDDINDSNNTVKEQMSIYFASAV